MKYPITPEYLTGAPDPIVDLFLDLEAEILKDICRRFKLSGEATESAIAQMKILQENGMSMEKIEKAISETLNLSEKELDEIFDRAIERNKKYYDYLITKSDIVNADYKGIENAVSAIRRQTRDEFINLTRSLGFAIRVGSKTEFLPIVKTYQKILDDAATQVLSGAFDYNTAVRNAVKRLTDSGLQMVDYESGWHNRVDVAVRRAVMTGVSQLSSQYAETAADILETDYREVTAHGGARDTGVGWQNHKAWQGKVYSVKAGDKYPNIYDVCGLGQVDGLEGANCRHRHYPFVEGVSERTYTDEQLASLDPPPFEYQGRTYTAYEATQKQRQIETAMRKCKREIIGNEATGQSEAKQDSSIRLRRLSAEYKAFSEAAGLRQQPERARVQR
ncbi:MAG: phage minor capsid protein [Bacteroidaceae bacterium]|nr:phage minor capsid protein [Bacteroidaceae bacterium]